MLESWSPEWHLGELVASSGDGEALVTGACTWFIFGFCPRGSGSSTMCPHHGMWLHQGPEQGAIESGLDASKVVI